jgi:hypothetical protein
MTRSRQAHRRRGGLAPCAAARFRPLRSRAPGGRGEPRARADAAQGRARWDRAQRRGFCTAIATALSRSRCGGRGLPQAPCSQPARALRRGTKHGRDAGFAQIERVYYECAGCTAAPNGSNRRGIGRVWAEVGPLRILRSCDVLAVQSRDGPCGGSNVVRRRLRRRRNREAAHGVRERRGCDRERSSGADRARDHAFHVAARRSRGRPIAEAPGAEEVPC